MEFRGKFAQMEKYYAVLNVSREADLSEIKKAYRKAVHMYHPDANGGVGDPEKFKNVVKAYQYLQKNHKSLGIKPIPQKKGAFASMMDGVKGAFAKDVTSGTYAKSAQPPRQRKTARKDEFASLDPVILQMPFDELQMRFTESQNDFVKRQSARALTYLFGAGALSLLRQGLEKSSAHVGEEILYCLGLIGDGESIAVIEKYLKDPNVKIACAAVRALQNINQGHARTLLVKIEKEGKALRLAALHFFEASPIRKLVRDGVIGHSEMHIVRYLREHTRQPMPVILAELGLVAE